MNGNFVEDVYYFILTMLHMLSYIVKVPEISKGGRNWFEIYVADLNSFQNIRR